MLSPAPAQSPVTAPISLLRLIAEDPEFRAKVESDPVAAFAEHGVIIDSETHCTLPERLSDIGESEDPRVLEWVGLL